MARITIEDCLKRVPNRFLLVHMAAKRVRQIREGSEYLVSSPKNEDIVVSLREVAAGKVYLAEASAEASENTIPEETAADVADEAIADMAEETVVDAVEETAADAADETVADTAEEEAGEVNETDAAEEDEESTTAEET